MREYDSDTQLRLLEKALQDRKERIKELEEQLDKVEHDYNMLNRKTQSLIKRLKSYEENKWC